MPIDNNYKIKYIKYKKKYNELKEILSNKKNIIDKIIILPKEYDILNTEQKSLFELYEQDNFNNPLSYIRKKYINDLNYTKKTTNDTSSEQIEGILDKKIISPEEYFLLSDSDKYNYEIFESDYVKFPNRVVPKNYIKIN